MFKQLVAPFLFHKYLLSQITLKEIKSRYKQSVVGYAWVLLNPLFQLLIYSFVFSIIFRFPTNNIPYPIFLFVGLLPWIYFQTSLSAATLSLVDNADLLRKINFPREILPYSVVLSKTVDFFFAFLLLLIFMLVCKIPIQISIVWALPLFFVQMILMTGFSLLFSTLNLFYRDTQYLINLLLLIWLYLTPVVYPLSLVPVKYVFIYKLNPMVGIIESYRSSLFNLPFDIGTIAWSGFSSLIMFIIGFTIFKKAEKVFGDIV
jgi:ABC-type polysaccharide/polyol phosphate export permease